LRELRAAGFLPQAPTIPSISPFRFVTVSNHDYHFDVMMNHELDFYEKAQIFHRRVTMVKHEHEKAFGSTEDRMFPSK
jgi:hypothetical protein